MNTYKITFVSYRVWEQFQIARAPFGVPDLERVAKDFKEYYREEVQAMTAEDALTFTRVNHSIAGTKPPFILSIYAVETERV